MMYTQRRGMMLAFVLVIAVLVAILLGALFSRLNMSRQLTRHRLRTPQDRYQSLNALNNVLDRVNAGESVPDAARSVSGETGVEVLCAGNSLLAHSGDRYVQVTMYLTTWDHVLFGEALDLSGVKGAFAASDPHAPAQGAPPRPTGDFAAHYRDEAASAGIVLRPNPAECEFHPGGGNWIYSIEAGKPSFLYVGGGLGETLGWAAGSFRWTLEAGGWTSSLGDRLIPGSGDWELRAGSEPTLVGTLLVEDGSLVVKGDARVQGRVIVTTGGLVVQNGTLEVAAEDPADLLAVATLRGSGSDPVEDWNDDPAVRPGDLILAQGNARLKVGDPARADETGQVIYAESRLVKRGTGLELAGVAASQHIEIAGVPASSLVWSPRVSLNPPPYLQGGRLMFGPLREVRMR